MPRSTLSKRNSKRTSRKSRIYLPKPEKGVLSRFGYNSRIPAQERHLALTRAIMKNGKPDKKRTLEILRHLNLATNIQSRLSTHSIAKSNMRKDVKFLQRLYAQI